MPLKFLTDNSREQTEEKGHKARLQDGSLVNPVRGSLEQAERTGVAWRARSYPELLAATLIAAALVIAAVLLTPFARAVWPEVPGFIIAYCTGTEILNLLVALLLVSKARIEGDGTRLYLAAAYFYVVLIVIPHIASFPDAFTPGMPIGKPGSAVWLWVFWHTGFACLIAHYALQAPGRVKPRPELVLLVVLLIAGLATYIALAQVDRLPVILNGTHYFSGPAGTVIIAAVLLSNVAAMIAVVARVRDGKGEDLWLAVGMVGACVDVWLVICGGQRFTLGWYCGRICGFSTSFVLFASLMNDVMVTYKSVALANSVLDRMTQTDALTKLGNRRMFDDMLQREWRRCRRDGLPLTVILFDVDEFKTFNDTYGHQEGDHCLEQIAGRLFDAAARGGDLATRYGGEEFALILPATDSQGSAYVANQVRQGVRDMAIPHSGCARGMITISAGAATLLPSENLEATELVRLADIALYKAKAAGRDVVVLA
jgi:diguanylate cyclase (GGDEF)-like protein